MSVQQMCISLVAQTKLLSLHKYLSFYTIKQSISGLSFTEFKLNRSSSLENIFKRMINGKMPKGESKNQNERNRSKKFPAATVYLQVLGSGAPGAPSSLYVSGGQCSYLFNCGEGSQRLAHEHKVKLGGLENVFVTHKSWRNVGGLPGMLLTLQDAGTTQMMLHGPPGIHTLYRDTRVFMAFDSMDLLYHNHATNNGKFGDPDDPMTIQAVPIPPANEKTPSPTPMTAEFVVFKAGSEATRGQKRDSSSPDLQETAVKRSRSDEFTSNIAMMYIGKVSPKLGKLRLELCVKAKVPPGPLYGQLKAGHDVTLADGSVVKAADVTDPDDPGPVFIVVEAPTLAHLTTLTDHPALLPYKVPHTDDTAQVVVHFTPSSIVNTVEYQNWLSSFASSTQHIFINDGNSCTGSCAVHRNQMKLHHIHPSIFPALADTSIPYATINSQSSLEDRVSDNNGLNTDSTNTAPADRECGGENQPWRNMKAATLLTYHLRPNSGLSSFNCPVMDHEAVAREIADSGCLGSGAEQLPKEYPEITFLGTGSSMPNKTRNVSGILVELSADKFMLLDCGEATYGQLVRLVGVVAADKVLTRLCGVYISHHHADHHIGLITVLQRRRLALQLREMPVTPLLVLAPYTLESYLRSYHDHFEPIASDYRLIVNQTFIPGADRMPPDELASVLDVLGLSALKTCYVVHCKQSFGVAFTTLEGKTLVYSGDTRPCDALVHLGKGCDVLIHEATLEDFLAGEAISKRHSTISEALGIARSMEAKHVLLTHFSQRYAKAPMATPESCGDISNVAFAYDYMRVGPSGIRVASALYPEFVKMFAEYIEEMKEKTAKKILHKERKRNVRLDLQRAS